MNAVTPIGTAKRPETDDQRQARLERLLTLPGGVLAQLNEWTFTGKQMRDAVDLIKETPLRDRADFDERSRLLKEFSVSAGIGASACAPAALHGRIVAMDKWCGTYDPFGQTDVDAFFEASGRQTLISTNDGIGFEPVAFRELIEFIAEMPF